jgi:hypothetical protein
MYKRNDSWQAADDAGNGTNGGRLPAANAKKASHAQKASQ